MILEIIHDLIHTFGVIITTYLIHKLKQKNNEPHNNCINRRTRKRDRLR
jgi:hypothetical protein